MGAGIRPEPINPAADLYDTLVKAGRPHDEAVRIVSARFGPPPTAAASDASRVDPGAMDRRKAGQRRSIGQDLYGAGLSAVLEGGLNLADEGGALMAGLLTNPTNPLQDFERNKKHLTQPADDFAEAHPIAAGASRVVGAVATGMGAPAVGRALLGRGAQVAGQVLPSLTAGQRVVRGVGNVAQGAAEAAVSGAGAGDGGIGQRAAQGARAAKTAAVAGGVLGGAAGAVGAAGRATKVTPTLENLAPRPKGAASGRMGRAIRAAGVRSHEDMASADVLVALERAGLSLDDVERAAAVAGPDARLYDIGGQPTVRMARGARTVPSEGSKVIDDVLEVRRESRPARVREATEEAFGAPRANAVETAESLARGQQARARPLYEKAYAGPAIDDPEVLGIFEDEVFQDAYATATRLAKREGVSLPKLDEAAAIPVQGFDYVKRALDDVIERRMKAGTIGRTEARQLRGMLKDALQRVDDTNPDYAAARRQYASDAEVGDAFESGRKFTTSAADDVEAGVAQLSDAGREGYRTGALANVTEVAEKKPDGVDLTRIFRTPDMQRKLAAVIDDPAALAKLETQIDELFTQRTNDLTIGAGSQTADKLQDAMDVGALGQAAGAMAGNPMSIIQWLGNNAAVNRAKGSAEERVNVLAKMLTTRGVDVQPLMGQLRKVVIAEQKRQARKGAFTKGAGRVVGTEGSEP